MEDGERYGPGVIDLADVDIAVVCVGIPGANHDALVEETEGDAEQYQADPTEVAANHRLTNQQVGQAIEQDDEKESGGLANNLRDRGAPDGDAFGDDRREEAEDEHDIPRATPTRGGRSGLGLDLIWAYLTVEDGQLLHRRLPIVPTPLRNQRITAFLKTRLPPPRNSVKGVARN